MTRSLSSSERMKRHSQSTLHTSARAPSSSPRPVRMTGRSRASARSACQYLNGALFLAYLHWIYMSEVQLNLPPPKREGKGRTRVAQYKILELYLLADFLKDVSLRNRTIGMLLRVSDGDYYLPSTSFLRSAFERTRLDSPLRQMLIDIQVRRVRDK